MNTNWSQMLTVFVEPQRILNQRQNDIFSRQHFCVDTDVLQQKVSKKRKKEKKSTVATFQRKNNAGVYKSHVINGVQNWCARIGVNCKTIRLYYGPDYEAAVKARKEAEIQYGDFTRRVGKTDKELPRGVNRFISNGRIRYSAYYNTYSHEKKQNKTKILYSGHDLTLAINARRKWEEDNGYKESDLRCYPFTNKPSKRNHSGVVGVAFATRAQSWIATGNGQVLYAGKSKPKAISARKKWEKGGRLEVKPISRKVGKSGVCGVTLKRENYWIARAGPITLYSGHDKDKAILARKEWEQDHVKKSNDIGGD